MFINYYNSLLMIIAIARVYARSWFDEFWRMPSSTINDPHRCISEQSYCPAHRHTSECFFNLSAVLFGY